MGGFDTALGHGVGAIQRLMEVEKYALRLTDPERPSGRLFHK